MTSPNVSSDEYTVIFTPNSTGALRASIGLASNFADVYAYVQFARTFIDTLI